MNAVGDSGREKAAPLPFEDLPRAREPVLVASLAADFALFASGSLAHMGVPIPLGFGTWRETVIVPAAAVEGTGALGLGAALAGLIARAWWADRAAWWAARYALAAVLFGLFSKALRRVPEADTMSNDFPHFFMATLSTLSLVRMSSLRA